jgi:DNA-binding MarR family transcriptional regulator
MLDSYRLLIADVYELAGVSRSTSEQLARRTGATAAQWHVLSVVSDEPLTVSAAARRLGLSRQSVQRVVNDLLASGDLRAAPDPDDRRAPLITLTAAGRRSLRRLFADSDANRAELLRRAGVSRAELDRARRSLRRLIDAYRTA